jgi:hypothetical protein
MGKLVLHRTEDGRTRIQVTLAGDSAWLDPSRTAAKSATVQTEGHTFPFPAGIWNNCGS